jgi:tripartite-type tricarboxylate transporter receptor subunit TctC
MAEFLKSIGYPIKNVTGYRGSANTFAALERNELHGRIISQGTMETVYRRFLERDFVRPLLSFGDEPRLKPLKGVPTLKDLKLSTADSKLAEFMVKTWALLRTYAVPPGVPPDRVKILREAFLKALKSPKLQGDAKRQGVIVDPVSGQGVTQTIQKLNKLTQSNPEILKRYKKLAGVK